MAPSRRRSQRSQSKSRMTMNSVARRPGWSTSYPASRFWLRRSSFFARWSRPPPTPVLATSSASPRLRHHASSGPIWLERRRCGGPGSGGRHTQTHHRVGVSSPVHCLFILPIAFISVQAGLAGVLKEILEETCGFEFAKVYRFNGAARSIPVRLKRDGSEDLELEMPVPAEHAVKVTDAATVCGCALLALLSCPQNA